ncbi:MAG: hypothetical protein WC441_00535 [Patescibacteria group bacterium]
MNFNEILLHYQVLDSADNVVNLTATFTLPLAGPFFFLKIALGAVIIIYVAKKLWR